METPKQKALDSLKGPRLEITKKGSQGTLIIQKKPPQQRRGKWNRYA